MEQKKRDQFLELWHRYFNHAELPITFEYTNELHGLLPEPQLSRHRCIIGQLIKARNGRTLCLDAASLSCRGGGRYLSFTDHMFPHFEQFISHDSEGQGERYRRTPEQVHDFITALPILPIRGRNLVIKRWDKLAETDRPDGVIFFAEPDVLSGLFTLANFNCGRTDGVITPFGAGCTSIFYHVYREQVEGTNRAILGMFDPSARKCVKSNLLSFAFPYNKFTEVMDYMEESFLSTRSWEIVRRRIK
ncbi:MAG: DUF169 domain-containing protein [Alistipes sp.]